MSGTTAVNAPASAQHRRTTPVTPLSIRPSAGPVRRRVTLTAAVVGAFVATVAVLAITSTLVARVG